MFSDALFWCPHSAGIFGDISSDERIFIARRIWREKQSFLGNGLLQLVRCQTRLAHGVEVVDVYLEYLFHAISTDDDAAIDRHRAACITYAAAASSDREKIFVRKLEDRDHLRCRFRKDNSLGRIFFFYCVRSVWLDLLGIDNYVFTTDDRAQFIENFRLRGIGSGSPF